MLHVMCHVIFMSNPFNLQVVSRTGTATSDCLSSVFWQASSFGAFLDVLVDNVTRGVFYVWAFDSPAGVFFVLLEMLSFLCTHKVVCSPEQQPGISIHCKMLTAPEALHVGHIDFGLCSIDSVYMRSNLQLHLASCKALPDKIKLVAQSRAAVLIICNDGSTLPPMMQSNLAQTTFGRSCH